MRFCFCYRHIGIVHKQWMSIFTHLVPKFVHTSKLQLFLPRDADKVCLFCTLGITCQTLSQFKQFTSDPPQCRSVMQSGVAYGCYLKKSARGSRINTTKLSLNLKCGQELAGVVFTGELRVHLKWLASTSGIPLTGGYFFARTFLQKVQRKCLVVCVMLKITHANAAFTVSVSFVKSKVGWKSKGFFFFFNTSG